MYASQNLQAALGFVDLTGLCSPCSVLDGWQGSHGYMASLGKKKNSVNNDDDQGKRSRTYPWLLDILRGKEKEMDAEEEGRWSERGRFTCRRENGEGKTKGRLYTQSGNVCSNNLKMESKTHFSSHRSYLFASVSVTAERSLVSDDTQTLAAVHPCVRNLHLSTKNNIVKHIPGHSPPPPSLSLSLSLSFSLLFSHCLVWNILPILTPLSKSYKHLSLLYPSLPSSIIASPPSVDVDKGCSDIWI